MLSVKMNGVELSMWQNLMSHIPKSAIYLLSAPQSDKNKRIIGYNTYHKEILSRWAILVLAYRFWVSYKKQLVKKFGVQYWTLPDSNSPWRP